MLYEALRINLIYHPVRIFLNSSRKNHKLVVLAHFCQKFFAKGPDQKVGVYSRINVMNESFVQIQDQTILLVACAMRWQERWSHFWQHWSLRWLQARIIRRIFCIAVHVLRKTCRSQIYVKSSLCFVLCNSLLLPGLKVTIVEIWIIMFLLVSIKVVVESTVMPRLVHHSWTLSFPVFFFISSLFWFDFEKVSQRL